MTKPTTIIAKLNGQPNEYFTFTSIDIGRTGIILKAPTATVRTIVYDGTGRKTLDLMGRGEGKSTAFFANKSPGNLETALRDAFAQLKAVQVEAL